MKIISKGDKISTNKYWKEIFFLQWRHCAFKNIKDSMGILSNHLISTLHWGQLEDGKTKLSFRGMR